MTSVSKANCINLWTSRSNFTHQNRQISNCRVVELQWDTPYLRLILITALFAKKKCTIWPNAVLTRRIMANLSYIAASNLHHATIYEAGLSLECSPTTMLNAKFHNIFYNNPRDKFFLISGDYEITQHIGHNPKPPKDYLIMSILSLLRLWKKGKRNNGSYTNLLQ